MRAGNAVALLVVGASLASCVARLPLIELDADAAPAPGDGQPGAECDASQPWCSPQVGTGGACDSSPDCDANNTCAAGYCRKDDGQSCASDTECVHSCVESVCDRRALYRSVGPNRTTPLATGGSNALTVAGSLATFAALLPDYVGVGDMLAYDADGNGTREAIAYVHRRNSATGLLVKTNTGATPTSTAAPDQDWQLYRAYTALAWAIADGQDLTTASGGRPATIWGIACYGDDVDTYVVSTVGWTTSSQYYLWVFTPYLPHQVGVSQRHTGKWTNGAYRLEIDRAPAFAIRTRAMHVEGLQIATIQNAAEDKTLWVNNTGEINADVRISHNIVRGSGNSPADYHNGIEVYHAGSGTVRIWNNLVYNYVLGTATAGGTGIVILADTTYPWTAYVYNNTVAHSHIGILTTGVAAGATVIAKNNLVQDCDQGFGGTFDASSDFNVSSLNDAPNMTFTPGEVVAKFVDAANRDYHLAATDTAASGKGTDLAADASLSLQDDIDQGRRPGAWDIGADQR